MVQYTEGTTEQGSSGAGLLNQDGNIVGVLTGGDASCDNPSGVDVFGRMDVAWQGDSDFFTALQESLDPLDDCAGVIPGRNQSSGAASERCEADTSTGPELPPEIDIAGTDEVVTVGGVTGLLIVASNPNAQEISGFGLTLTLPDGLEWVGDVTASQTCGTAAIRQRQLKQRIVSTGFDG